MTISPSSARDILSQIKDYTSCSLFDVIDLHLTATRASEPYKDMDLHSCCKDSIPVIHQLIAAFSPVVLTIIAHLRTQTMRLTADEMQTIFGSANYTVRWNIVQSSSPPPAEYPFAMVAFAVKDTFHTHIHVAMPKHHCRLISMSTFLPHL